MNPDADTVLFSNRRYLFNEVGIVLPNLFLGKHPSMRKWLIKLLVAPNAHLVGTRHVEFPGCGATDSRSTAAPYAVAHMGVGGVVNAGLAQVANVLFVFLDLLVAAGKIECDLRHIVHAYVADVPDRDPGIRIALLDL